MPKRILFLHSSSDMYGSGRVLLDSIKILKENGYEIFVILPYRGPLCDELEILEARIIICNVGALRKKYFTAFGLFNRGLKIIRGIFSLRRIIREQAIDVVYSNTSIILAGAIAARLERKPHLYHIHEIPVSPRLYSKIMGRFINFFSDEVIVVSDAAKNHWRRWVAGNKIMRVYNGMPVGWEEGKNSWKTDLRKELRFTADDILVCNIGRTLPVKGHHYFLDIAQKIARKVDDVKFLIVGDPFRGYEELYDSLLKRTQSPSLKGRAYMLGFRADIPAILAQVDLLVHTSISPDSLPTVILEAMAMGKPVVATSMGGAVELVADGETGFIIPPDDVSKASEVILKLIADKKNMIQIGRAGHQRILRHFSLELFNTEILSAVNSLAKRSGT